MTMSSSSSSSCCSLLIVALVVMSTAPAISAQNCYDYQLGDVRVVTNAAGSNTVEQCRHVSNYAGNAWLMVCGYGWDCREATVACRDILNVNNPRAIPSTSYYYGSSYNSRYLIRYTCTGSEHSLSSCSNYTTYCYHIAHVVCIPPRGCPHHGAIRLVGGETSDTGRLELCYNGEWSPLSTSSGFGYNEAATACRQLGYTEYPRLITDGRFNSVNASYSWITNIVCDGDERALLECDVYNASTSCSFNTHIASQIGLQCYKATTQCIDGAVRMIGGRIEQEGRVEVCLKGVWGSVCRSQFSDIELYVMCSYLGYHGNSDTFLSNGAFGSGEGPVLRGFDCQGWEQNMAECFNSSQQYQNEHNLHCNSDSTTAVRCSDFCRTGDVRLVGGPNSTSGIVEFCNNNLWGLIAEPGWSDNNAGVVCKQLGLERDGVVVHNSSCLYTRPKKLIHLANVFCRGSENVIMECASYVNTQSAGINMMKEVDVAGVVCQVPSPATPNPETPPMHDSSMPAASAGVLTSSTPPVHHMSSTPAGGVKQPSSTKVFCRSSTPAVVQPSSSAVRRQSRARHYSTPAAVVQQSSSTRVVAQSPTPVVVPDGQQQTSSSQQMMMMVLQSSVVTAVFMGLIFFIFLLLLGSVATIAVIRWSRNKKIERLSWQNLPADEDI